MIFKIVMVAITLILIICCVLSFVNKKDNGIQQILMLVVTAVIGAGTIFFNLAPSSSIKVVIPEITEVVDKNSELTSKNKELNKELVDATEELRQLKESLKNNVSFLEYEIYVKNNKINVNASNAVAKIDDQIYFSQSVLEEVTGFELNEDIDKKIMYLGKYPEEQVDLLSVCEPYDPTNGFSLGNDESFKIYSKTYSSGIRLDAYYRELRSVKFNLGSRYSELSFNIGHIDETGQKNSFTLNIYVDGNEEPIKQIVCNANIDIDDVQSIPLNYGKTLTLEWLCDQIDTDYDTSYGLINMKLK